MCGDQQASTVFKHILSNVGIAGRTSKANTSSCNNAGTVLAAACTSCKMHVWFAGIWVSTPGLIKQRPPHLEVRGGAKGWLGQRLPACCWLHDASSW